MHPLQSDLSGLSDQDLEKKVLELNSKYFQAMRFSPSVASQIVLLLDGYKAEQYNRSVAKSKKAEENGDNDINELIRVN
jgi:ribosomal protein L29